MIANSLLWTMAILLAYVFWLADQLKFMAAYRNILLRAYGGTLVFCLAVLFANVFGLALTLNRRFLLKDTGRKLSHLDKQLHLRHGDVPLRDRDRELG